MKENIDDIKSVMNIIQNTRLALNQLKQLQNVNTLQVIGESYEQLGKIAQKAESINDVKLLQMIFYKLLPELDKIDNTYRNILEVIGQLKTFDIDVKLYDQKLILNTFYDNNYIHLAADTTANAGDYILVRSLKKLVENFEQDIHWCTVDVRSSVTDGLIEACNKSKGVILGGGGLFLCDTNRNDISGWQWPISTEQINKIKTPLYVMGVGYNRFRGQQEFASCFWDNVNALVKKSSFFGLRNHGSIEAIRGYLNNNLKEKVVYHPCATTVISKLYELPVRNDKEHFIALNCAFDRSAMRYGTEQDEVMFAIARVCKKLSANYKIKCYIHCSMDEKICEYLNAVSVEYEMIKLNRTMCEQEYLSYFVDPELVLAIRGHAQMIPFGCKTPTVSMISHDKLKWFLEDIHHPEWGVEVLDKQFEDKLLEISKYMLSNRELICRQIEEAQNKLWNIILNNLKQLR